jgi:hypothetical protein
MVDKNKFKGNKFGRSKTTRNQALNLVPNVDKRKIAKTRKASFKGNYDLAFVESFANVTERDVELKLDYGLDMVADYAKVPKEHLKYKTRKTTQTLASVSTVYYVSLGAHSIGKLSIQVLRTYKAIQLIFVFRDKHLAGKGIKGKPLKPNNTARKGRNFY